MQSDLFIYYLNFDASSDNELYLGEVMSISTQTLQQGEKVGLQSKKIYET